MLSFSGRDGWELEACVCEWYQMERCQKEEVVTFVAKSIGRLMTGRAFYEGVRVKFAFQSFDPHGGRYFTYLSHWRSH